MSYQSVGARNYAYMQNNVLGKLTTQQLDPDGRNDLDDKGKVAISTQARLKA